MYSVEFRCFIPFSMQPRGLLHVFTAMRTRANHDRDLLMHATSMQHHSLAGQTLSASGRGSGDIPILELCRHAGIFPA